MNVEDILVVTATLGDSCGHLSRSLSELRQFTGLKFRQLVSDDGTADRSVCDRQREVCRAHGADWTENPGPVFGISYNLNHLFQTAMDQGCQWVFLLEDAVRPGWGWLETALDALSQIGNRLWGPEKRRVSAIGLSSSFEMWHLASAGILPTDLGLNEFFEPNFKSTFQACYDAFWGSARHPHWNDGLWCWQRMHPGVLAACQDHKADGWPEVIRRTWRDPVLRGEVGCMKWQDIQHQNVPGSWIAMSGWPVTRGASAAPLGPSAWALHNLKAWKEVGGFRDGVTFYEGHIGTRYSRAGYVNVNCECPPWTHWSGLAFRVKDQQRTPRHHIPVEEAFVRDFGCDGHDHKDIAALAHSYFKGDELDQINKELSAIRLYADPRWEKWMP